MLKKYSQILMICLFGIDMVITAGAWLLAYPLRFGEIGRAIVPLENPNPAHLSQYAFFLAFVLPIATALYYYGRLYVPRREDSILREMFDILKVTAILFFVIVTVSTFLFPTVYSRGHLVFFAGLNLGMMSIGRASARTALRWARSRGFNQRYALIVGSGKMAQNLAGTLRGNPWIAIRPIGFLAATPDRKGREIDGLEILGTYADLVDIVRGRTVDQVFFALPFRELHQMEELVDRASEEMVDIRIVPDFLSFRTLGANTSEIDGLPVISLQESPLIGLNRLVKRAMDIAVSLLALIIFGLPMLIIATLVRLSSAGPILYRQRRMGLDGHTFEMLKFRSMRVDAEQTGAAFTSENDPRRTRVGSFLRNTSLDELPQFFNVLRGDMSIVGPRPERPVFIEQFREEIPGYMLRHRMKAGITGWAQVNGWRGNTSIKKRIQYDLYYIENWSIWFDLRIMLMTIFRGFVHKNAY